MSTLSSHSAPKWPMYVSQPALSLAYAWKVKLPLALAMGTLWEILAPLVGVYETLLTADPVLVMMAVTLVGVDFLTGVTRSLRDGKKITSRRLRGMGWKIVEYSVVAGVGIILANGATASVLGAPLAVVDDAALLYVALTEAVSILENVTGSKGKARGIIDGIRSIMKGKLPARSDEVNEDSNNQEITP